MYKRQILSELKKFNIPFTVSPLDEGRRIDPSLLPADGTPQVLLLDGSALVDSRLPALLSQGGERLCFIPQECVPSRAGLPSITLSGRPYLFAGVARISLSRLAGFALPSPLSLAPEAIEAVGDEPHPLLHLSTLPNYKPDMRAHVPFLFFPVTGPEANPAAKSILISSSQKLVLDWPAWYIHRPIENALISQICEWSITPNQLTVLNNLAAFAALATGRRVGRDGALQALQQLAPLGIGQLRVGVQAQPGVAGQRHGAVFHRLGRFVGLVARGGISIKLLH